MGCFCSSDDATRHPQDAKANQVASEKNNKDVKPSAEIHESADGVGAAAAEEAAKGKTADSKKKSEKEGSEEESEVPVEEPEEEGDNDDE